jgi:hypothetical protein
MQDKRETGQRRWGLYQQFPLMDSKGVIVITDRRRFRDRRLGNTSFEDRLLMLSEMPPPNPDRENNH